MSNTHGIADFAHELQAVCADQLPACILSQTGLAVPVPPGLVLPAFATAGYVRETDTLVYVEQEAHTVTLTGSDGNYWLALSVDNWTSYAQWTTEPGTTYRWRPNATQPAEVAGLLVMASVTVAGGAVTAVTPLPSVTRAAAGRALLGLGTMATQNAASVAITGGTATLSTLETTGNVGLGTAPTGQRLQVAGATTITGNCTLGGTVYLPQTLQVVEAIAINAAPGGARFRLDWLRNTGPGILVHHSDTDGGNSNALQFTNLAGAQVGSIATTSTATAYNTSSDRRLKTDLTPLTGALDVMKALQPLAHRWKADGSPGVGFAADDVQQVVDGVVTGEANAVDAKGQIVPQMMDYSKLVPYLTGACKELLTQIEALTARLAVLEAEA